LQTDFWVHGHNPKSRSHKSVVSVQDTLMTIMNTTSPFTPLYWQHFVSHLSLFARRYKYHYP